MPILPAHLIYKTANGDDRMMSYESLSDGGFATGSMLGSEVDLSFIMTLLASLETLGISKILPPRKLRPMFALP